MALRPVNAKFQRPEHESSKRP